jgi:hypothetical protein
MKLFSSLMALCISCLISLPAFAHPGHDHTSTYASMIHFLWLAPTIIAGVFLYRKMFKNRNKSENN